MTDASIQSEGGEALRELARLEQRYVEMFGEAAPTMELPSDPKQAAALLCRVIETGDQSLIDKGFPPDADV